MARNIICTLCKCSLDESLFYPRAKSGKRKNDLSSYCKGCVNTLTKQRHYLFKEACLAYKGNACELCGYFRNKAALDFHHRDSSTKEFSPSTQASTKFSEKIKLELDKCMLLCANCHREIHNPDLNVNVGDEGFEPSMVGSEPTALPLG
jgi:hypothetical protein